MVPEGWTLTTIGDLCNFSNGHGFRPPDWSTTGLPIIRIQNLNGSNDFNYYNGVVEDKWIVEPNTILFAWAGTKGVSFGPSIWNGPKGVLNQHIYRIHPKAGVDSSWLFAALQIATKNIEQHAHGFKSTLLHVRKEDITGQPILFPPLPEQHKIAEILSAWDRAIDLASQLIAAKKERKRGLMQQLLTGKRRFAEFEGEQWQLMPASEIFNSVSRRQNENEELLSVTQERGVIPRVMLDTRVVMPDGATNTYKLVEQGDFVISLRSFQGGIEYSEYRGIVSPAYTILKPRRPIADSFYKHLFKSEDFIGRLAVAVIGIRDGKQINYDDFASMKLAYPSIAEQYKIGQVLDVVDTDIRLLEQKRDLLKQQKQGLMQQLLSGRVRVPVAQAESSS